MNTFEKAPIVIFDYEDLKNRESILYEKIDKAFGPHGIGLCLVSNVPDYEKYRTALLPQANILANLPKEELDKLTKPEMYYFSGWSHGKEQFKGRIDYTKGSYYAFVREDEPIKELLEDTKKQGGVIVRNVWPQNNIIENFEKNFKNLGNLMCDVGSLLGYHLDKYIKHKQPNYIDGTIEKIIKEGNQHVGQKKTIQDDWCGWHNDFSVVTGLASAMYFDEKGNLLPNYDVENDGGLFVKNRFSEQQKAFIPNNCLGFQIGEVVQILSGGILEATPHCVVRGENSVQDGACRNNYVCFISPNQEFQMKVPDESLIDKVANMEGYYVSKLKDRWKNNMPYGIFSSNSSKSIRY
ncbi:hypothetical protein IMG5_097090 [Ichthyophthirius multifiliis]|uniref:Uncharacterized protein n=1 Tax=Ichthyophthirius multifiliis TaxID=5932 RepID=G0QRS1_ICHMU|nr:hypothetical protein IMG5_097090 [Ichthyophthirius multifiliis]EGR32095.1 hypothetical protein IMG5_097090 [Ichthyophthirius multifiliis]|eukprot:XP_004035581.1 hypothetical protein IMG5_097090 [Ichthyophthirius multifiliis]